MKLKFGVSFTPRFTLINATETLNFTIWEIHMQSEMEEFALVLNMTKHMRHF